MAGRHTTLDSRAGGGAQGDTDGAWQDVEQTYGQARGPVGSDGEPEALQNEAAFEDPEVEQNRIAHLALSKHRAAAQMREDGGKIGMDPRAAASAAETDRAVQEAKARHAMEELRSPELVYDPQRNAKIEEMRRMGVPTDQFQDLDERPDVVTEKKQAAAQQELDPADAEFFQIAEAEGEQTGQVVPDGGQVTMSADRHASWVKQISDYEHAKHEFDIEKASMKAGLDLIQGAPLRTAMKMGASRDSILREAQELGLLQNAPPAPRHPGYNATPAIPGYDNPISPPLPELGEQADPATRALHETVQQQAATIHRLEQGLGGLIQNLDQREQARATQSARDAVEGRFAATRTRLMETAHKVPALKSAGQMATHLVDLTMHEMRGLPQTPDSQEELVKIAMDRFRELTTSAGLAPKTKAKVAAAAKAGSRRRAAPAPTRVGRSLPIEPATHPHQRREINFEDPDQRRNAALSYLYGMSAQGGEG